MSRIASAVASAATANVPDRIGASADDRIAAYHAAIADYVARNFGSGRTACASESGEPVLDLAS